MKIKNNSLYVSCDNGGIFVKGADSIGSTCDTVVHSIDDFIRVAEVWWRTYVDRDSASKCNYGE